MPVRSSRSMVLQYSTAQGSLATEVAVHQHRFWPLAAACAWLVSCGQNQPSMLTTDGMDLIVEMLALPAPARDWRGQKCVEATPEPDPEPADESVGDLEVRSWPPLPEDDASD